MKSLDRDWLVFQLRVTKVAAIATGKTWMFSTFTWSGWSSSSSWRWSWWLWLWCQACSMFMFRVLIQFNIVHLYFFLYLCLFFDCFFSTYLQVDFDANITSFCLFSSVYLQVDRPCVVAVGICRRATVVADVLGVQEGQSQPTLLYITWSPSPWWSSK